MSDLERVRQIHPNTFHKKAEHELPQLTDTGDTVPADVDEITEEAEVTREYFDPDLAEVLVGLYSSGIKERVFHRVTALVGVNENESRAAFQALKRFAVPREIDRAKIHADENALRLLEALTQAKMSLDGFDLFIKQAAIQSTPLTQIIEYRKNHPLEK